MDEVCDDVDEGCEAFNEGHEAVGEGCVTINGDNGLVGARVIDASREVVNGDEEFEG